VPKGGTVATKKSAPKKKKKKETQKPGLHALETARYFQAIILALPHDAFIVDIDPSDSDENVAIEAPCGSKIYMSEAALRNLVKGFSDFIFEIDAIRARDAAAERSATKAEPKEEEQSNE
jgi:hypothetical protein